MDNFIPYAKQWISEEDIKEVEKVLRSDWITQGPSIDEFEEKVAEYCDAKYAVATSSGTDALHLAYLAVGIKEGDEVITTPMTFVATANAVVYCGGVPVFADIDLATLNIDPVEIEKKITEKTKAIAPVDFAGVPCDYKAIKEIAEKHNLIIVEDACQALGATYKGKKIGGLNDFTVFSFHPAKHITTGEGGMVLTNNKEFADKMRKLRHHGAVKNPDKGGWYYDIEELGYNFRITSFQCALGISQFKKLDKFVERRREIVKMYNEAFSDIDEIITPKEMEHIKSSWHIYPIQFKTSDRRKVFDKFRDNKIGVQVHYTPVHLLSFYKKKFGCKEGDYPLAEKYSNRAITLPLFPKMTDSQVERVIKVTKGIVEKYKK